MGTTIAAYLLATNNTDKKDKLFVTIDGYLEINSNTQEYYEETINDEDVYNNYRKDINIGFKIF